MSLKICKTNWRHVPADRVAARCFSSTTHTHRKPIRAGLSASRTCDAVRVQQREGPLLLAIPEVQAALANNTIERRKRISSSTCRGRTVSRNCWSSSLSSECCYAAGYQTARWILLRHGKTWQRRQAFTADRCDPRPDHTPDGLREPYMRCIRVYAQLFRASRAAGICLGKLEAFIRKPQLKERKSRSHSRDGGTSTASNYL